MKPRLTRTTMWNATEIETQRAERLACAWSCSAVRGTVARGIRSLRAGLGLAGAVGLAGAPGEAACLCPGEAACLCICLRGGDAGAGDGASAGGGATGLGATTAGATRAIA